MSETVRLSDRMTAILDMIPSGRRCLADIGCDHALLSIAYAIREGYGEGTSSYPVVALDVNAGPLEAARRNVSAYGLSSVIDIRLSDGFDALGNGEADTVVIAGMGGRLMMDILDMGLGRLDPGALLILSPQSDIYEFRRYLAERDIGIIGEDFVKDEGKFYNILICNYSGEKVSFQEKSSTDTSDKDSTAFDREVDLMYGKCLIDTGSAVLEEYLMRRLDSLNGVFCHLSGVDSDKAADRLLQIRHECALTERALERVKANK